MKKNKKENLKVKKDKSKISAKKAAVISAALSEVLKGQQNYKIISIQKINPLWKR